MEISETLRKAWTAVQEAELPAELNEAAFREAIRLLSPTAAPPFPSPNLPPGSQTGGRNSNGPVQSGATTDLKGDIAVSERDLLGRVASQTGVPQEKLAELVHLDDGVLKISLPGIRLGKNNAEKTRVIAQIITIVRGFGLEEKETSVDLIRAEASRLKCYDAANFSAQLGKVSGFVLVGSPSNRSLRPKSAGIEAFPSLIETLMASA